MTQAWANTQTVQPATKIWDQPTPETLEERVAFFKDNGFIVLRSVLERQELDAIFTELDRMVDQADTLPRIREGIGLEPVQDKTQKRPTFRKIGGVTDLSEPFGKLGRHPVIVEHLHALLGDRIELWRDIAMLKPARVGREKPWHQDSVYWPFTPMNLVSAMTALDDASPENGCMQVVPGSHKQQVQHYGQELMVNLDEEQKKNAVYVPLKAGDTLLFHSLLLHGSERNTSEKHRRVCIVSYKGPDAKYTGKGEENFPLISQR